MTTGMGLNPNDKAVLTAMGPIRLVAAVCDVNSDNKRDVRQNTVTKTHSDGWPPNSSLILLPTQSDKPVENITKVNKSALQFLDLMTVIDKYSEVSGTELNNKLKKYVDAENVDFSQVKELLPLYPDKVFRNIYMGGMMGELV